MWANWTDGIYRDYRTLGRKAAKADSVVLHDYAGHLFSSQAFAFNLFLPFREGRLERLSRRVSDLLGEDMNLDRVVFEWVPPGHLLGEIDGERPRPDEFATAVDVVLCGWLQNGRRTAVLIEVKLTEGKFTRCNGRGSPGNRRKDVCQSASIFLSALQDCYLRRPVRKERDRRYWEIFTQSHGSLQRAFPNVDPDGECPFAYDMQQPMHNLAIAQGMVQEDMVQKAWFILCGHDNNRHIASLWQEWQRLVGDAVPAPFLQASDVIAVGEQEGLADWAKYMRIRYQL